MVFDYSKTLNPEKALIWRIVHRDNLSWILANGMHSGNSVIQSANWVHIGSPELTQKRSNHVVPVPPSGFLNDYVPFYFTPFSPMMRNIHTGWGDVQRRSNEEIVILVSSLHDVKKLGLDFVFTNSHAYYAWAEFFTDLKDLDRIDWPLLQKRDFRRDPDDPGKFERYQAEALIHQHCPVEALKGVVCYNDEIRAKIEQAMHNQGLNISVYAKKNWYF